MGRTLRHSPQLPERRQSGRCQAGQKEWSGVPVARLYGDFERRREVDAGAVGITSAANRLRRVDEGRGGRIGSSGRRGGPLAAFRLLKPVLHHLREHEVLPQEVQSQALLEVLLRVQVQVHLT